MPHDENNHLLGQRRGFWLTPKFLYYRANRQVLRRLGVELTIDQFPRILSQASDGSVASGQRRANCRKTTIEGLRAVRDRHL